MTPHLSATPNPRSAAAWTMSRHDHLDTLFPRSDTFAHRHLGPRRRDIAPMLETIGKATVDELLDDAVPKAIRFESDLDLPPARGEMQAIQDLREIAAKNQVFRSYIGMGYHGTITPPVILRNVLENPGWYTQYTPYQAEISQGRLEALLNYQTLVLDLTGLDVANASLLDEATAAAEAMTLCRRVLGKKADGRRKFFVSENCHPQTIAVVQTHAEPLGIEVVVGDAHNNAFDDDTFGVLLQYPGSDGQIDDLEPVCSRAHDAGALAVVAADLLSLTLLRSPGDCGADIVVGNSQRFGVPMGYGGPHAAFMAARDGYKRQMPGRIIGVTKDTNGGRALRMALQTREQHIRRDKATSNICTAQVLLAVMASTYAVYHGPQGLERIAGRIRGFTGALAAALRQHGCEVLTKQHFDTLRVRPREDAATVLRRAREEHRINLRDFGDGTLGVSLDETVSPDDLTDLVKVFGIDADVDLTTHAQSVISLPVQLARQGEVLEHPTFHRYRSETELLRYLNRLQAKDLSLTTSMIPLGSCTMKLNATAEMIPVTWPEFGAIHPFAPLQQAEGYRELHERLENWLSEITGFAATSLQPNAGSQGEYAGLLTIRAHHQANGETQRDVCLIPSSAHGTNPASAIMAGMRVVLVKCDDEGNIDVQDLRQKTEQHRNELAALMITYPSTHGVFEATIREICALIHEHGGQVYLDGANMNAQVGVCRPGDFGADVCHLNLHKTFCIPHGGGGPGVGPICVAEHLAPYLPGHPVVGNCGGQRAIGPVSAAPFGSPSILPISYAFIAMMGPDGLREATEIAILNANYIAKRLEKHFPVLYRGASGLVAHECILDCRGLESAAGITVADIAKRLMDYGFHAPTMSWPVAGTLMVEPTESESKEELDRFCDAMIAIRAEVTRVESGEWDKDDNPLKHAPHTAAIACGDQWDRSYSREVAAFPAAWTREHKYWPTVSRVDDVFGDRNLVCSCPAVEAYA